MKNARINQDGKLCCGRCGSTDFVYKRTFRSKLTTGPFALLTHKKIKCQACGAYNQTGDASESPPVTIRDLLRSEDKGAVLKAAGKEFVRGRTYKGR